MEDKGNSNLPVHSPEKGRGLKKFSSFQEKLKLLDSNSLKNLAIPRTYNQLVLFVLDGSRSMKSPSINKISKAQEIHKNVQLVLERLRESRNRTSFDVAFIAFSEDFKNVFGIKELNDISKNQSFNPVEIVENSGDTNAFPALEEAERVVQEYMKSRHNDLPKSATILFMTDGMLDDYNESLTKIEEIKQMENVLISTTYFEQLIEEGSVWHPWNEKTGEFDFSKTTPIEEVRLKRKRISEKLSIFSSDAFYTNTVDPEEIRSHMINSISATSHLI